MRWIATVHRWSEKEQDWVPVIDAKNEDTAKAIASACHEGDLHNGRWGYQDDNGEFSEVQGAAIALTKRSAAGE